MKNHLLDPPWQPTVFGYLGETYITQDRNS